ncbi:MAG: hypothetical protein AB1578_23240, partial [Thermodesulfobacteriota bacterium]
GDADTAGKEARMQDTTKLLTPEEFAQHTKISRALVYELMKDQTLRPGVHYLLLGPRTRRFPWGPELVKRLLLDSLGSGTPPAETPRAPGAPPPPPVGTGGDRFNWGL